MIPRGAPLLRRCFALYYPEIESSVAVLASIPKIPYLHSRFHAVRPWSCLPQRRRHRWIERKSSWLNPTSPVLGQLRQRSVYCFSQHIKFSNSIIAISHNPIESQGPETRDKSAKFQPRNVLWDKRTPEGNRPNSASFDFLSGEASKCETGFLVILCRLLQSTSGRWQLLLLSRHPACCRPR